MSEEILIARWRNPLPASLHLFHKSAICCNSSFAYQTTDIMDIISGSKTNKNASPNRIVGLLILFIYSKLESSILNGSEDAHTHDPRPRLPTTNY